MAKKLPYIGQTNWGADLNDTLKKVLVDQSGVTLTDTSSTTASTAIKVKPTAVSTAGNTDANKVLATDSTGSGVGWGKVTTAAIAAGAVGQVLKTDASGVAWSSGQPDYLNQYQGLDIFDTNANNIRFWGPTNDTSVNSDDSSTGTVNTGTRLASTLNTNYVLNITGNGILLFGWNLQVFYSTTVNFRSANLQAAKGTRRIALGYDEYSSAYTVPYSDINVSNFLLPLYLSAGSTLEIYFSDNTTNVSTQTVTHYCYCMYKQL